MPETEAYFLLFTDILMSNFAFNSSRGIILDSMKIFGNYDIKLMLLISIIAYSFSIIINYFLGRISYNIIAPLNDNKKLENAPIHQVKKLKLLPMIIVLSFIPFFGKFIIFFLGFCRIRLTNLLLIAVSVKLVYYFYYLA